MLCSSSGGIVSCRNPVSVSVDLAQGRFCVSQKVPGVLPVIVGGGSGGLGSPACVLIHGEQSRLLRILELLGLGR